jgi:[ribosomal protein S5]-alanine N-acetyltransferase
MKTSSPPLENSDRATHPALPDQLILQAWRHLSPVLQGRRVTLREPRLADAGALLALLSTDDVSRFMAPPPHSVESFEQYIVKARERRAAGEGVCFGVVPQGCAAPVGLFQVRQMDAAFNVAEWGFALASAFWGDGIFFASAPLVIDFVFDVLGARRLEARAAVQNGRGNGALRKLGAQQEALLRRSLLKNGVYLDQILWAIDADDWRALGTTRKLRVH